MACMVATLADQVRVLNARLAALEAERSSAGVGMVSDAAE
jgi:hypothetical protein